MKKQIRVFNYLNKKFDLTGFYCINLSSTGITLQGYYCSSLINLVKPYVNLSLEQYIEGDIYVGGVNVRIVLTTKD